MSDALFGFPPALLDEDDVLRTAFLSRDGVYRYRLGRRWGTGPYALFIMLNPSTADAMIDDPTIRRCIGFAKREGCGGLFVGNLFAYRATRPEHLVFAEDPEGPENTRHLKAMIRDPHVELRVAAWGAHPQVNRACDPLPLAFDWKCLGRTQAGHPRHPLYVRSDQPLEEYP